MMGEESPELLSSSSGHNKSQFSLVQQQGSPTTSYSSLPTGKWSAIAVMTILRQGLCSPAAPAAWKPTSAGAICLTRFRLIMDQRSSSRTIERLQAGLSKSSGARDFSFIRWERGSPSQRSSITHPPKAWLTFSIPVDAPTVSHTSGLVTRKPRRPHHQQVHRRPYRPTIAFAPMKYGLLRTRP